MSLESGILSLKRGEFVLLYDSAGRENEIDMVVAAEFVTPEHVARMRQHAGGLLCMAIDSDFGNDLGLHYMHDILANSSWPANWPSGDDATSLTHFRPPRPRHKILV